MIFATFPSSVQRRFGSFSRSCPYLRFRQPAKAASDHRFHRQRAVALAREVAPLDEPSTLVSVEIANLGILFDCLIAASAAFPFDNRLQAGPGDHLCLFSYAVARRWVATV
ncbi:hypothetical protein [Shinella sedimenti]|uniref:Uncharacterized protein n=1 Tax=Shinella sedimenti TaxID=2919913 RepID=A0ABT0CT12_9HYPH|nr:hypothetical protein [Shinella sedimenti]MCJ8151742.1 hypothetical protein [Shinella sedimenti]